MTPEELQALNKRISDLEYKAAQYALVDRFRFVKMVEFRGLKIGFFSATPVVQQTAHTAPSGGGTGVTDAIDVSARAALAQIRTTLNNLGLTV